MPNPQNEALYPIFPFLTLERYCTIWNSSSVTRHWKLVRVVTLTRNTQEDEKVRGMRNEKEIETRVYLRQAKGYLRTKR